MKTTTKTERMASFVFLLLVCTISGCATVGSKFNHDKVHTLEIGQLRSIQYREVFGKPKIVSSQSGADGDFEHVRYVHAYADMGTAKARVLVLEFKNEVLNAYNYCSGFDGDKTTVNVELFDEIRAGQTKEQVLKILGKPTGKALCPSLLLDYKERCEKGTEVWAWSESGKTATLGRKPIEAINIFTIFNSEGKVAETFKSESQTGRR